MASPTTKAFAALVARVAALEQAQGHYRNSDDVPEVVQGEPEPADILADTFGVDHADLLRDAGYVSAEGVRSASDDDLLSISGIGAATLKKIRAAS